ncbi:25S rRNA adenine-N(1) methyltransferase [Trametes pubescens]|uniref:25S rRNA adenine-N(1) methyltransferase n=1 Tax=Trametes pubescens TaxID=154538 RepID=A0A1M2W2S7_TRAPU|nr:25S rRNA adenine-N(1) methyltransferase [Trametes pubescens]
MPKARKNKRKTPVTAVGPSDRPSLPSGSSSRPQATRTIIRRFHVLIKKQTQLQNVIQMRSRNAAAAQTKLDCVEREIEELGGLEAYQRMSSIGQSSDRGGGSEIIFIAWLRELNVPSTTKEKNARLRQVLLEVGALKPDNYASCAAWVDVTPIDLHSRHPSIQEQDFLLMDPTEHRERWDAISLSLVLNFVPDAKDRG